MSTNSFVYTSTWLCILYLAGSSNCIIALSIFCWLSGVLIDSNGPKRMFICQLPHTYSFSPLPCFISLSHFGDLLSVLSLQITQCEIFLSMLVKFLDSDKPLWQRTLAVEVLHSFCNQPNLLRSLKCSTIHIHCIVYAIYVHFVIMYAHKNFHKQTQT